MRVRVRPSALKERSFTQSTAASIGPWSAAAPITRWNACSSLTEITVGPWALAAPSCPTSATKLPPGKTSHKKNKSFFLKYFLCFLCILWLNNSVTTTPDTGVTTTTTRLPLVIVLTFVFPSLVHAQTSAASPSPSPSPKPGMTRAQSQRAIIATEKKLWEAWKNKDMKPFRANLSADAVMIGDSGVADKKTSLTAMEGMSCEVTSYELSDIKVTF